MSVRTAPTERAAPTPPGTAAVEAEDLSFAYAAASGERVALDGVTLAVPRGAVFGLLGPNGSGKSTLISLAAGLRRPASGTIRVLGETPGPATRIRTGVLFQEQCLDPLMTARETLWLHGRLYGMPRDFLHAAVDTALEGVALASRADDPTRSLSGGMRRRLELARALLPAPELLLLDEPTTGLDPDSKHQLWQRLTDATRGGVTILLATNDVTEAERYCDYVAFLYHGRLAAEGTPSALKANLRRESVFLESPGAPAEAVRALETWPGVGRVTHAPPAIHVTVDDASAFVVRLFEWGQLPVTAIRIEPSTLEDAYFQVCGHTLHEQEATT